MSKFSDKLQYLRERRDWSKTKVAKHLGIGLSTYANWEYGYNEPGISMLNSIATLYDVSTDYLLGHSENPNSNSNRKEIKKVDLAKDPVILAYDGKVASKEETDTVKNILKLIKSNGKN